MTKYTTNYTKMAILVSIQVFLKYMRTVVKENLCIISRLLDPCIMSCESRAIYMSRLLRAQVLYIKCRNKAPQQARSS